MQLPERFTTEIYAENHLIFGDGKIMVGELILQDKGRALTFSKSEEDHKVGDSITVEPTDKLYFNTVLEFKNVESAKIVYKVLGQIIKEMEQ